MYASMAGSDWDEIKRLAADFQRAQLSSTVQRLSESNCIEIISKLLELKLLDVLFTTDGKEYVTPQHLTREILDELYIHGGRINMVELAKLLSVDLSQVEARVNDLSAKDGKSAYTVILGQLIDKGYQIRLAQEINDKLQREGQVCIADLTRAYDLPGEFLQMLVEREIGKTIDGRQDRQDPRLIFTEAFVARNRSVVRGALCGVTRPTTVSSIVSQCNIPESIFYSVVEGLIEKKQVSGTLSGKQGPNSLFVPSIYSKSQSDWVNNFFKQNGYLEYDALRRLGISDPAGFVKKHNFSGNIQPKCLVTCAIGNSLFEQVEAAVDEAVATGAWIDVEQILPSVFTSEDVGLILTEVLKSHSDRKVHVFCQSVVVTEPFLKSLSEPVEALALKRAEESVASGAYLQSQLESRISGKTGFGVPNDAFNDDVGQKADRREERRKKAAGGKGGGGTQGRETKTKSTKKKHQQKRGVDSEDEEDVKGKGSSGVRSGKGIEFLSLMEVEEKLKELGEQDNKQTAQVDFVQDASSELLSEIAVSLHPSIQWKAETAAREFLETAVASSAQSRRKAHAELQERISASLTEVRLYERGARLVDGINDGTVGSIGKHLLRTICNDIANEIFDYASKEGSGRSGGPKEITPEVRIKILSEVTPQTREPLLKLHKSISGNSVEEFLSAVEGALSICDIVLRKQDKKKEKAQLQAHRYALLEKLSAVSDDPALALHLASLVLFQSATGNVLHASGKFVPSILSFLRPHLPADVNASLQAYHDLVLKLLTMNSTTQVEDNYDSEKHRTEVVKALLDGLPGIKDIASNFKKLSSSEKSHNSNKGEEELIQDLSNE